MPNYSWPEMEKRKSSASASSALDGSRKASGQAKYSSDLNPPGPAARGAAHLPARSREGHEHRHQRGREDEGRHGRSRDLRTGHRNPVGRHRNRGRRGRERDHRARRGPRHQGRLRSAAARRPRRRSRRRSATARKPAGEQITGDPDAASRKPRSCREGKYGIPVITHCCLEPHGQVIQWQGDKVDYWPSTQAVSSIAGDLGTAPQDPGRQHPRPDGLHGRRLRQQVPGRSLGQSKAPSSRRQAAASRSSCSSTAPPN